MCAMARGVNPNASISVSWSPYKARISVYPSHPPPGLGYPDSRRVAPARPPSTPTRDGRGASEHESAHPTPNNHAARRAHGYAAAQSRVQVRTQRACAPAPEPGPSAPPPLAAQESPARTVALVAQVGTPEARQALRRTAEANGGRDDDAAISAAIDTLTSPAAPQAAIAQTAPAGTSTLPVSTASLSSTSGLPHLGGCGNRGRGRGAASQVATPPLPEAARGGESRALPMTKDDTSEKAMPSGSDRSKGGTKKKPGSLQS